MMRAQSSAFAIAVAPGSRSRKTLNPNHRGSGVKASSGAKIKGGPKPSSLGVLIRNLLGSGFITAAAQGFHSNKTDSHIHTGGRVIGKLIMEPTHRLCC
ncbi:unnamed protein product [Penicillium roqueforti FM164]|uniref:Uncharacterized protein n=1 Tax=Penicillium roqueforti (strain FM164) TaxID=1365484 RepID=W6R7R3_PENRF|nr:unnamed protein product [Penicillium roqueforti FM164]